MDEGPPRILILFAHPSIDRSEVNVELLAASRATPGVTVVDLYGEYPQLQIDIDREQQRLLEHDIIIFMFPLYWYSTPSLLKEWQDLVLEYGFAYGEGGTALQDKVLLCSLTAGGAEAAYCSQGSNQFTLRELLRPLEQTATLCGMRFLAPFVLFGSRSALEEGRIDCHVRDWRRVLQALHEGCFDLAQAEKIDHLNDHLDTLTLESA
ncbi:MAG: NAD(P)H-dependent oxidoreductase [Gammaproteobacteria bacterium]|nr:NAD(P)H-dependent oxidoreductase [Gammaproteobacteria bacterium]